MLTDTPNKSTRKKIVPKSLSIEDVEYYASGYFFLLGSAPKSHSGRLHLPCKHVSNERVGSNPTGGS